jgi:hypothetical protein
LTWLGATRDNYYNYRKERLQPGNGLIWYC